MPICPNYTDESTHPHSTPRYILSIDNRQPGRHRDRVIAARKQFDELMPGSAGGQQQQQQQQQPDVVILHANHWVLKVIAEGYIEASDRDLATLSTLPEYYVESFIRNFTMLAQQVIS